MTSVGCENDLSKKVVSIPAPKPTRCLSVILIAAAALFPAAAMAQGIAGDQLFRQRCQSCHAIAADKPAILGPNLRGVVGRKAGVTGFRYSPALKAANIVWTRDSVDKFLSGPARMVPGTRMVISVPDAKQRAAIVSFLATQK